MIQPEKVETASPMYAPRRGSVTGATFQSDAEMIFGSFKNLTPRSSNRDFRNGYEDLLLGDPKKSLTHCCCERSL